MRIVLRNGTFRLETNEGKFIHRLRTVTLVRADGSTKRYALAIKPLEHEAVSTALEAPASPGA